MPIRRLLPILSAAVLISCGPHRAQAPGSGVSPQQGPQGTGAVARGPELGKEYPSPDEAEQTRRISDLFTAMTERKYPAGVRPMRRDAHTKAHACVQAEFTVGAAIPERAKLGLFKTAATYPAWIRFSNAFSSIQPDTEADVKGMAIKVMGVEGEKLLEREKLETTQDFLLISTNVFFSPNVSEYLKFTEEYVKNESTLRYVLWPPSHWRQARILYQASRVKITNPLTTRFWSSVPFKLGPAAVKYSAKPCGVAPDTGASGSSPNFLREAMVTTLRQGEACFDFMVQFQSDPVKMPVEDPSVEWDENASPFVPVARVRVPKQTFDTERQVEYCENLSFTPWHSLPEHQPIGGVNRIRKTVYERISTLRHAANGAARDEPDGLTEFNAPVSPP